MNNEINHTQPKEYPSSPHGPMKFPEEIYKRAYEAKMAVKGRIGQIFIDNLPSFTHPEFAYEVRKIVVTEPILLGLDDDTKDVLAWSWFSYEDGKWSVNVPSTRTVMAKMNKLGDKHENTDRYRMRFESLVLYHRNGAGTTVKEIGRKDIEVEVGEWSDD